MRINLKQLVAGAMLGGTLGLIGAGGAVAQNGEAIYLCDFVNSTTGTNIYRVEISDSLDQKIFDGAASVNTTDDTIAVTGHGFSTGDAIVYGNGGGTTVAGLENGQVYFVIVDDPNTIKLADSKANAESDTALDLSGAGSGINHTLTSAAVLSYITTAKLGGGFAFHCAATPDGRKIYVADTLQTLVLAYYDLDNPGWTQLPNMNESVIGKSIQQAAFSTDGTLYVGTVEGIPSGNISGDLHTVDLATGATTMVGDGTISFLSPSGQRNKGGDIVFDAENRAFLVTQKCTSASDNICDNPQRDTGILYSLALPDTLVPVVATQIGLEFNPGALTGDSRISGAAILDRGKGNIIASRQGNHNLVILDQGVGSSTTPVVTNIPMYYDKGAGLEIFIHSVNGGDMTVGPLSAPPTELLLCAGQTNDVGDVTIQRTNGNLQIDFITVDGACMRTTHLHLCEGSEAECMEEITNKKGNPQPGQFAYQHDYTNTFGVGCELSGGVISDSFTIPLADVCENPEDCILNVAVAHADILVNGSQETAFAGNSCPIDCDNNEDDTTCFSGKSWGSFFTYDVP